MSSDEREMSEGSCGCPSCGQVLTIITASEDIPYFGQVLQTTFLCSNCGWRFCDIFPVDEKEGAEYFLEFGSEDMSVRVVKSSYCTIRIPELGITVEPGPASEGYITNIEGILVRMRDATESAMGWGTPEQREKGGEVLEAIESLRDGSERATLIMRDPRGFSAIVSERAKRTPIVGDGDACQETNQ